MTKLIPITPSTDPVDDNERSFTYDENGANLKTRTIKGGAGSLENEINKVPAGGTICLLYTSPSPRD